jgi:regulator-associated protein of mTOR
MTVQQSEQDDAGSQEYNYQVWRVERNERVIQQVAAQTGRAGRKRWDKPIKTMQSPGCPLHMAFHAYDSHLVVGNESDTIRSVLYFI